MEKGFLFLDAAVPGIRWDAKYAACDNFTGKPVPGYGTNRIVVSGKLAERLRTARDLAEKYRYGLLVWDAYRPKRAVDAFLAWTSLPEDDSTRQAHYPGMSRKELMEQGCIAGKSAHARGGAVDLTLYFLDTGCLAPMGTCFDFMNPRSRHDTPDITPIEAGYRKLLRLIMERSGFAAYENEWWHYELLDEPYPDTYFDFPII